MPPVVVVRPLSGYANRLQAIVSAALLAEDLEGELLVCWEESDVAPVPATAILGPAWCAAHLRTTEEIVERTGVDPTSVPPYLTAREDSRSITLAGKDRGEQHFMPALRDALAGMPDAASITLSAGGRFVLDGDAELTSDQERAFRVRRFHGYSELPLHPEIERAAAVAAGRSPYVGLHLRYSDRSTQTPWTRSIGPALERVASIAQTTSVFIASDFARERDRWTSRAEAMGLSPWSVDHGDFPRADPRSARGALVDWRILTRSDAMVYFAASSFAEEAAVASGHADVSIGLGASAARQRWMRGRQYGQALVTYPRRHHWFERS